MQRSNPVIWNFYNSTKWEKVRKAYKKYRHNLCERCGGVGYIVHHKEHLTMSNIYNPEVTINFNNLELLCMDCHNKEHFGRDEFDSNGELKPIENTVMDCVKVFEKKAPRYAE